MAAMRDRCTSMACVKLLRVEQVILYVVLLSLLLLPGLTAARLFEVSTSPAKGKRCCRGMCQAAAC